MQDLFVTHTLTGLLLCVLALVVSPSVHPAQAVPAGPQQLESISFRIGVIYPAAPPPKAQADLQALAARNWPQLSVIQKMPVKVSGMALVTKTFPDFRAPDADMLKRFGRGLSATQIKSLEKPKHLLLLHFAHPKRHTLEGLRTAYALSEELARKAGGFLWDDETREVFTPEKWHAQRLATWAGGVPEVSDSTVIHSYQKGELARAITLGMHKFGLPDIVVEQFPWSSNSAVRGVINLVGQALAEGGVVKAGGQFDLDLKAIAHEAVRERQLKSLKASAQGVAKLVLVKGTWEEGDPENRLIEIQSSRYPGPDDTSRQDAMLGALYGTEGAGLKYLRHDEELLAASNAAKKKLPSLHADFQRGFEPGEYLQVKAPFKTPAGGNEWMWVEVKAWRGTEISGSLQNVPRAVPSLKMGQGVKVRQQDVFDYIRTFADGREEGNTTGRIIEKMQESGKR